MKAFWSFLIVFCSVLLWVIPFTDAAHNFKTDIRTDEFTVTTTDSTNSTVQLFTTLYSNDTSSIDLLSHDVDDSPVLTSYNTTTRAAVITGLAGNTTRQLDVSYDVDALGNATLISLAAMTTPWLWYAIASVFPLAALYALWFMRR